MGCVEITGGGAGAADTLNTFAAGTGTAVAKGLCAPGITKKVWTATAPISGIICTILDNATQNKVIGYWKDTAARTLSTSDTYTVTFGATLFTVG